jgi:hypothetical protein
MWWIGALYLGMSVLILLGLTLLYIPAASWLCVSRTGITMSVAFWRRFASWSRVRDVRLVVIDGPITSEPVIEVVFNESSASWLRWRLDSQRGFWLINVRLFWLVAGHAHRRDEAMATRPCRGVNCSNGGSSPTMGS